MKILGIHDLKTSFGSFELKALNKLFMAPFVSRIAAPIFRKKTLFYAELYK